MTQEEAFLEAILAEPRDDVPRLVFADWLEEQGDPRGEWLRVVTRLDLLSQQDPTEMGPRCCGCERSVGGGGDSASCEVLSRLPGSCGSRADGPQRWERLRETDEPAVRRCGACGRSVRYCWSVSTVNRALRSGLLVVQAPVLVPE
jgi:uncharacterized protein (TIGR02996 family)